jgi:hypothetical protein
VKETMKRYGFWAVVIVVCALFLGTSAQNPPSPGVNPERTTASTDISQKRSDVETRWASFENPLAQKGAGASENRGFKGHPFDSLEPGETKTLMHVSGSGEIRRMWFTLDSEDPETLRSLRLQIYWDDASSPAVDVPFGDFFVAILGHTAAFENALFANPEGRSFVCYIPMPFRKGATVKITNESGKKIRRLFYDIDFLETKNWNSESLYFHAVWRRELPTKLGRDFEILPKVEGEGRFIGTHIGVIVHQQNTGWWGEGEVKVYLDGDSSRPTLAGTGTEDYIGTGWGQAIFTGRFQGCTLADEKSGQYGFYRYHLPDPVYFHRDIRVTISQLGGENRSRVDAMMKKGVPVNPVAMDDDGKWINLLDPKPRNLMDVKTKSSDPGTIYARQDDVSAVALFYLDSPESHLPALAPIAERIQGVSKAADASK